jgi:hypothetical protein
MAYVVSGQPVTGEALVQFHFSPCSVSAGLSGTRAGFFSEYFGFTLSVSFCQCCVLVEASVTNTI